jgi:hypothetical protein
MTYQIVRFTFNAPREVLQTGLTLEEAQAHCSNPATSGETPEGVKFFDGYEEED